MKASRKFESTEPVDSDEAPRNRFSYYDLHPEMRPRSERQDEDRRSVEQVLLDLFVQGVSGTVADLSRLSGFSRVQVSNGVLRLETRQGISLQRESLDPKQPRRYTYSLRKVSYDSNDVPGLPDVPNF